jgi:hypothetical protein
MSKVTNIAEHPPTHEHMCIVCNRSTNGCDRVRAYRGGRPVASIHAECIFGLPWTDREHTFAIEKITEPKQKG